jgi:hypothetical protein
MEVAAGPVDRVVLVTSPCGVEQRLGKVETDNVRWRESSSESDRGASATTSDVEHARVRILGVDAAAARQAMTSAASRPSVFAWSRESVRWLIRSGLTYRRRTVSGSVNGLPVMQAPG